MERTFATPLVRWDGIHLVLDLELLERHLRRLLHGSSQLEDLSLSGEGDVLRLSAFINWRKLRIRIVVELVETRLRLRRLGFRMRRVRTVAGVPVPVSVVEKILAAIGSDRISVIRGQAIVVVDLSQWMPKELDLSLLTVQATERALHLWFGPGAMSDLPQPERKALPAGTPRSPQGGA